MQRKISQEEREGQTVRRQGECMFVRSSLSTQHQFMLCHLLAHRKRRAGSDEGGHRREGDAVSKVQREQRRHGEEERQKKRGEQKSSSGGWLAAHVMQGSQEKHRVERSK